MSNIFGRMIGKKTDEPMESVSTSSVFKISGVPDHTFVERHILSQEIDDHLDSKDGILLFLGYSKSGKTVFRKTHIESKNFNLVTYRGNKKSTVSELYEQIASQLKMGQAKEFSQLKELSSTHVEEDQIGNKNVGHMKNASTQSVGNTTEITAELYPSKIDVNFLCHNLSKKNVLVIIEDYHLVDNEFNSLLSEDLKHFLDEEIMFLLIGIPSSPNRALRYNPDLSGRMNQISFDYLYKDEIRQLVKSGSKRLNVEFTEEVVDKIIESSFKNAYLVQYICRTILLNKNIRSTAENMEIISDVALVDGACKTIASKLDADYFETYNIILAGARAQQADRAFNQYEEVLKAIKHFSIEDMEKGITYKSISAWTWSQLDPDFIAEVISKGKYQNESSFKSSINTQIRNAFDKINENFDKNSTKPILYIHDRKIGRAHV